MKQAVNLPSMENPSKNLSLACLPIQFKCWLVVTESIFKDDTNNSGI